MPFSLRGLFVLVALGSALGASAAGPDASPPPGWTAAGASGPVHTRPAYARGDQWTRVRTGDEVDALAAVRTGGRGEATLVAGARTLVIGPDSEVELPALDAAVERPEALQDRGTVAYEVANIDVVTPYLVAEVEHATFRVATVEGRSVVDVFEGSVVVTSRLDGGRAVLSAGEGATVDLESDGSLAIRPVAGDAVARIR